MKPHSLRRGLWLANLLLGAAVVAVFAWLFLEVRPAVAKVTQRPVGSRPADLEKLRTDYEAQRLTGLKWKPEAPVTDTELKQVILREDYAKKRPRHWIFSGPMPPVDQPDDGPVSNAPPPPTGLEVLGTIAMVIYSPPDNHTILFDFNGKSLPFRVGDFVRQSETDPGRFKITGLKEIEERVIQISYDVYGKDPDKPERSAVLTYDHRKQASPEAPWLRPEGAAAAPGAAPAAAGGAPGTPAAGAGPDASPKPGETAKPEEGTQPAEESGAKVIDVAGTSTPEPTLQDLKPEIEVNPNNHDQRAIKFDTNSYRYFHGKNVGSVAETVKTSVATDPETGRTLGLRITGFAEDAPADVFDVRKGDILVSINGQKVTSRAEAIRIAQSLKEDQLVTVVIDRNGRQMTYRVDPSDPRTRRQVRYFDNLK